MLMLNFERKSYGPIKEVQSSIKTQIKKTNDIKTCIKTAVGVMFMQMQENRGFIFFGE